MTDYLYYRWAGRVVRHIPGRLEDLEMLEARQWIPAQDEARTAIAALDPEDRSSGGFCARLSQGEAQRMVEALGGKI